MFEKFTKKAGKMFSDGAIENAKSVVVKDIKENHVSYIMAAVTGVVVAAGAVVAVKAIIGMISSAATVSTVATPTYSVTYNYYITLPKA